MNENGRVSINDSCPAPVTTLPQRQWSTHAKECFSPESPSAERFFRITWIWTVRGMSDGVSRCGWTSLHDMIRAWISHVMGLTCGTLLMQAPPITANPNACKGDKSHQNKSCQGTLCLMGSCQGTPRLMGSHACLFKRSTTPPHTHECMHGERLRPVWYIFKSVASWLLALLTRSFNTSGGGRWPADIEAHAMDTSVRISMTWIHGPVVRSYYNTDRRSISSSGCDFSGYKTL